MKNSTASFMSLYSKKYTFSAFHVRLQRFIDLNIFFLIFWFVIMFVI